MPEETPEYNNFLIGDEKFDNFTYINDNSRILDRTTNWHYTVDLVLE